MHSLISLFVKLRNQYRSFVGRLVLESSTDGRKGLEYWQNRFFATAIFYALPVSLLSLIPSVILELQEGHNYLVIFNIIALVTVACIAFNNKIDLRLRKILIAALMVLFAVVTMAFLGSFTMGCIYLFPLSVFIALQFSDRAAYSTVGMNFIICTAFALDLWLKLVRLPALFANISLNHWLIYSVNFLLMDLVVVILIRQLLTGFDRNMAREAFVSKELQRELDDKNIRNEQIKRSEAHYRTLFFQSPLPKWIFDTETLRFLQVNDAAVKSYGYTAHEFLQMGLPDIHHAGEVPDLLRAVDTDPNKMPYYITRHVRKDGQLMHVEVRRSDIFFGSKKARLIIATDITELINHNRAIELRNKKMLAIAHLQSHVVRLPLANIIGITDLIMQLDRPEADKELFDHLDSSVKRLDDVLSQIVRHVEEVLPGGE